MEEKFRHALTKTKLSAESHHLFMSYRVKWLRQQEWFPRFTIFLLQRERMEYYYFHDVIPSKYLEATEFINALRIFLKQEGIRNVTV